MYLKSLRDAQFNETTGVRNQTTDEALKDGMHASNYGTPGTPFAYDPSGLNSGAGANLSQDVTVIDPRTGQGVTISSSEWARRAEAQEYYNQLQHGGGDMIGTRPVPVEAAVLPEISPIITPFMLPPAPKAMYLPASIAVPVTSTEPGSAPVTTMQTVQDVTPQASGGGGDYAAYDTPIDTAVLPGPALIFGVRPVVAMAAAVGLLLLMQPKRRR